MGEEGLHLRYSFFLSQIIADRKSLKIFSAPTQNRSVTLLPTTCELDQVH